MERRAFLKSSCNACLLVAAGYIAPQLAGCSAPGYAIFKTEILNKKISMPVGLFQTNPIQMVRPKGWYYDIAVQQKPDNTYTAILLQCTHQANQLIPAAKNGYTCSLHGSQFDESGLVRKGPASKPLQQYKTSVENNNLIIEIVKTP